MNDTLLSKDPQTIAMALLGRTPLFSAVSRETLGTLASGAMLRRYDRDAALFQAGDQPEYLHILMQGSVQLSAGTPDGREAVVELLHPVDTFIMAAVLTSQPYLMSARAVEPTQVLLIPARVLLAELKTNPELALTLLGSMAQQYRHMVREIKDLRLRTASQRLAVYLLHLVQNSGNDQAARLPCDKKLLAARLGMTPESLSRAISELRGHGVNVRGDEVRITDLQTLHEFCRIDQLLDTLERDLKVMLPGED
jgi:CRP/FNR family transcriptional activator FtrB